MRGVRASLLAAAALAAGAAAAQPVALVDRIVAVVNRDVVTWSELRERVEATERQLRRQGTPPPERAVIERQLLERLILEKAQLQVAREAGIRVDDAQLERTLERIAQDNGLAPAEFRRLLERDGVVFERFREEVRVQMLLARLREREVEERIEVSETEVDLFLEQNRAAGGGAATQYSVAHVLVRLPEQASPERIAEARARAERARAEAQAGGDFARIAAAYSDADDALAGGALGWRSAERLPELFAAALKDMKPGTVSEVLRSPGGFHVLKLLELRQDGAEPQLQQTRVRHILVRATERLSETEARRKLADLRERIVIGGADFGELARQHSEDATAARGGSLEWVYPGDTVPEFERAMDALAPGAVSQPVKTPFGWHLIQVLERRTAGLTPERRRLQARLALRERKADEAWQEWLRQLRDRAWVEIRLDQP